MRAVLYTLAVLLCATTATAEPTTRPTTAPSLFGQIQGKRVVFLLDRSGSMLPKFDDLRHHAKQAVMGLAETQQFNIVFYSEDPQSMDNALLAATRQNQFKAREFLDSVVARGQTDPVAGLNVAFAMNPDEIYFLTDGDFPDNDAVVQHFRKLNANKKVKVHTFALLDGGDYEKVLQQIARDNGGRYKRVTADDLGK